MKKYRVILIVLAVVVIIGLGFLEKKYFPAGAKVEGPPSFLRLHVLANSDSTEDQELKLAVRDLVLVELNSSVREAADFNTALEAVKTNLPAVQKRIKAFLAEKDCGYSGQTKVAIDQFPAVSYASVRLPEGDYWALRVTLGEGKGQNWWCVLYPPLCFLDLNDPEAVTVFAEEAQIPPAKDDSNWKRWQRSIEREVKKIWVTQ